METYDFIIIGSGIGGLVSAQILTKNGYKVIVLEKNEQFGGALQIFKREGETLDTGVHYIGGLAPGQNLYQYFKYLGLMDKLSLQQLDLNGFDIITFENDKQEYPIAQGYENFVEQLAKYFPAEKNNLKIYIDKIREICDSVELYNIQKPKLDSFYTPYHLIDTYTYIHSIIKDNKLANILVGNNLLYAGERNKTPLYVHALITNSYIQSAWRCKEGGSQIANILIRSIRDAGSKVLRNKEVVKIVIEENVATQVVCKDGDVYKAKNIISNCTPIHTYDLMSKEVLRKNVKIKYAQQETSIGAFTFHAILKDNALPYFNFNRYHFNEHNVWVNHANSSKNWPENMMLFTPYNNKENLLSAMTVMDFKEVALWKETTNLMSNSASRGMAYEEWKKEKEEILLSKIKRLYPEIENQIIHIESSTPLSYRDYLHTMQGSMYGYVKNIKEPYNAYIPTVSKVSNVHFTGQDINLHGILGVTLSAFLTCMPFVEIDNVLNEVRNA
ncbi:MAG: FAD-dependent oxidoreductase [Bacteroidota bacterium]